MLGKNLQWNKQYKNVKIFTITLMAGRPQIIQRTTWILFIEDLLLSIYCFFVVFFKNSSKRSRGTVGISTDLIPIVGFSPVEINPLHRPD